MENGELEMSISCFKLYSTSAAYLCQLHETIKSLKQIFLEVPGTAWHRNFFCSHIELFQRHAAAAYRLHY